MYRKRFCNIEKGNITISPPPGLSTSPNNEWITVTRKHSKRSKLKKHFDKKISDLKKNSNKNLSTKKLSNKKFSNKKNSIRKKSPKKYSNSYLKKKKYHFHKSGYIIGICNKNIFIDAGASYISKNVLYIPRIYKENVDTNETLAVIGIPAIFLMNNSPIEMESFRDIVNEIQYSSQFNKITLIDSLGWMHLFEIFLRFRGIYEDFCNKDDIIILNIEPKAEGKLENHYPIPKITIPGGGMEIQDQKDFENTAIREFMEETGFDIKNKYSIISKEKIKRNKKVSSFSNFRKTIKNHVSIYFLCRVNSLL